jgi:hypothetical protein
MAGAMFKVKWGFLQANILTHPLVISSDKCQIRSQMGAAVTSQNGKKI